MGDILSLSKKMERAMRNGTGFKVTDEELHAMMDSGAIEVIHSAKLKELQARCPAIMTRTSSANGGSTKGVTANPPTSGKPLDMTPELARSYIAQQSAGA